MRKTVYWIEGDGIGPDVWKSARPVIDEAIRLSYGDERGFDWKELLAGEKALKETGTLLPDETLAALRGAELAIKGKTPDQVLHHPLYVLFLIKSRYHQQYLIHVRLLHQKV